MHINKIKDKNEADILKGLAGLKVNFELGFINSRTNR